MKLYLNARQAKEILKVYPSLEASIVVLTPSADLEHDEWVRSINSRLKALQDVREKSRATKSALRACLGLEQQVGSEA